MRSNHSNRCVLARYIQHTWIMFLYKEACMLCMYIVFGTKFRPPQSLSKRLNSSSLVPRPPPLYCRGGAADKPYSSSGGSISNLYHIETVNYPVQHTSFVQTVIYRTGVYDSLYMYSSGHPMKYVESDVMTIEHINGEWHVLLWIQTKE